MSVIVFLLLVFVLVLLALFTVFALIESAYALLGLVWGLICLLWACLYLLVTWYDERRASPEEDAPSPQPLRYPRLRLVVNNQERHRG